MMQHIALVTTSYPDSTPGSEAAGGFVKDFAQELATKARVTVVAAGSFSKQSTSGNLTIRRFAVPRLPLSLLSPLRPADWATILLTLRRGGKALESLVKEDQPDHVFALWVLPSGYWAYSISKKYGIPFSTWALGSDIWSLGKLPVVRSLLRNVLKNANSCYADGYQLGLEVEKLSGKACHFLPSTRQIDAASPGQLSARPPYKLAFLGRWHPNKGIDLLLDALSGLTSADWLKVAEIRIFGGGPLADTVKLRVEVLKAEGRPLTLGGYLGKPEASALICWADYLLLPSRIESIPVIFSDAVKLGTPIVSTPVGDLPRLYSTYKFGVIAGEAAASAYCEAIKAALNYTPSDFLPNLDRARQDFDLSIITDTFLNRSVGAMEQL
ncbi:MAG TPA: glycosyltransferase [Gammaproteobacteria bacterium]|mgnify:CR=1 FL=1|nr:glycosyltransferase [Gammaproteobacteria bacterium]